MTSPTIRALPRDAKSKSRQWQPLRRIPVVLSRIVVWALFISALSVSVLLVSEGPSTADVFDDAKCVATDDFQHIGPEPAPAGVEAFLPQDTNRPWMESAGPLSPTNTPNEIYGVRGMTWSATTWNNQRELGGGEGPERVCSIQNQLKNTMAKGIFDFARATGSSTMGIRQRANDPGMFLELLHQVMPAVKTMRDELFIPGAVVMVILVGIWMIFRALSPDKARDTYRGFFFSIATISVATMLMMPTPLSFGDNSSVAPSAPDDPFFYKATVGMSALAFQASEAVASAILVEPQSTVCQLPEDAPSRGTRLVDCSIWETMIFKPWAQGQFGPNLAEQQDQAEPGQGPLSFKPPTGAAGTAPDVPAAGQDVRLMQIRAQTYAHTNDAAPKSAEAGVASCGDNKLECDFSGSTKMGLLNQVRAFMWQNHRTDGGFTTWQGITPDDRLSIGVGAAFANFLTLIYIAAIGLISMMWNAAPIALGTVLALVALFSIFPSLHKHFRSWLSNWFKSGILSFVFNVLQIFSLFVLSLILALKDLALGWKCLLMLVMIMIMFQLFKAVREDAVTPNLGGDPGMFDPETYRERIEKSRILRGAGEYIGASAARKALAPGRTIASGAVRAARIPGNAVAGATSGGVTSVRNASVFRDRLQVRQAGNDAAAAAWATPGKDGRRPSRLSGQDRQLVRQRRMEARRQEREQLLHEKYPQGRPKDATGKVQDVLRRTGAAVRTGGGATARGAAAGTKTGVRGQGIFSATRAGSVGNTGASDAQMRRERRDANSLALAKRQQQRASRSGVPAAQPGRPGRSGGPAAAQPGRPTAGQRGATVTGRNARTASTAASSSHQKPVAAGRLAKADAYAERRRAAAGRRTSGTVPRRGGPK